MKRLRHFSLRSRIAAAGLGLGLIGAGTAAYAAVSPTPEVAPNGNAGYNAVTTAATGYNQVQTVVTPTQYGTTIKTGAQGVQLCSSATNQAQQLGLASTNLSTTYAVDYASGVLPSPGCPTAGVLASPSSISSSLSAVPYGHSVWLSVSSGAVSRVRWLLVCVARGPLATTPPTPAPTTPVPTPTGTTAPTATPSPTTTVTPAPPRIHRTFTCHWVKITLTRDQVLYAAQDLNATGATGDAAGVFTKIVNLPAAQVFNHADAGVNENQTAMVPCASTSLIGPAAYITQACQPVATFEYTEASIGASSAPLSSYTTSEGISPAATGALVAPNNSQSLVNTGPHGSSTDAATAGDHFVLSTANAPTS